jgi:hypothetical protein
MNEKPVKVDIDFNEALRRIAKTQKSVVIPESEEKKKTAPLKKKDAVKVI